MTDHDNVLDIGLDADDYAKAAAEDNPAPTDRTYLSEEQFQATKAAYVARHDDGNLLARLADQLPPTSTDETLGRPRLANKHVQRIAEAAGELYLRRQYHELVDLLEWLRRNYDVDSGANLKGRKLGSVFDGWEQRCRTKLSEKQSQGE